MDPDALKANVLDGVSAIMPVHLYGRPADLEPIGSRWRPPSACPADRGRGSGARRRLHPRRYGTVVRAGTYGVAGCFSYYPGKNLGAFGDAGSSSPPRRRRPL